MASVVAALLLTSAHAAFGPGPRPPGFKWFDTKLPRDSRVQALVDAMSTEEKVAQLVVDTPAVPRLWVPAYHWRNNILHGTVDNGVSTQFPQSIGMAASFDTEALRLAARVMADEQRAKHNLMIRQTGGNSTMDYGLDLWGPNINMFRDPRWGRGQETYGEDPILTSHLLEAFVHGLQRGAQTTNALGETLYETIATCKHFVGYSVDKMPPRLSFDPNVSETDLRQYFYPAWEKCAATAVSVMCAYNGINGNPMCMSPLIEQVLRADFNFTRLPEAYVVTDSGALDFMVTRFHRFSSPEDAAVAAMRAGVDLNSGDIFGEQLGPALQAGRVTMDQIDTALTRLLHARMALGLFDPANSTVYAQLGEADIMSQPHRDQALAMSRKALLLLKNTGDLLPLDTAKMAKKKIAVVGWGGNDTYAPLGNYMGCGYDSWSPRLTNCSIITPLAGIKARYEPLGFEVTFARGCDVESNDTSQFAAAVALAKAADVVVFVGGNRNCEGGQGHGGAHCESEGHDRPDLEMPGVQTELLKQLLAANRNVVLAALTGSPISMNWEAEHLPAIITIWYGGQQMGTALADALAGATSPAGRSPFTWVTGLEQLPDELAMSPTAPPGRTYRHLDQTPLYQFGYGLSYGAFSYSKPRVAPGVVPAAAAGRSIAVCALVTNDPSALTAEEVVQVYATPGTDVAAASPPRAMLVGFVRTDPLAPGDSTTICVSVSLADLRLMGASGAFGVLAGSYTISIGGRGPGPAGRFVHGATSAAGVDVQAVGRTPAAPLTVTLTVVAV